MKLIPIELYDDGLRLVNIKTTDCGHFRIIRQHNPEHIARVIQEKRKRKLIQETNELQWVAA